MTNLKTYCVSNLANSNLEKLDLTLVGVGENDFPKNYITCRKGDNIQQKEKYYSELTFHYWFWKNELKNMSDDIWIGFCQKRRFWIKDNHSKIDNINDLKKNILRSIPNEWNTYDAFVCDPIQVSPAKKIKLIKRGWKNWIKDPSILFNQNKHNIKLQFDMFHGYGNLYKAIDLMKSDQKDKFKKYVNTNTKFNPNIMVISKKPILNKWFNELFDWLFKCEKIFGFDNLRGYDTGRLYAYLSERYLSFWFNEFCKVKSCPWVFFDPSE
tara:strand:- start:1079 stop:1882 length:804 start_codon:yes stop_codon:yes gene_type:complete